MRDYSDMIAVRATAALLAVVIAAWFAVGIRQARDTASADATISAARSIGTHDAARVTARLKAASWLNPNRHLDVLRGRIALLEDHRSQAEAILLGVARSEPMNVEAWVYLAQAAIGRDPAMLREAVRNVDRLFPLRK